MDLNGEDGTVQGFLQLANVPFVGSGVMGSAAGMDKDVAKRLLRDAALPVVPFLTRRRGAHGGLSFRRRCPRHAGSVRQAGEYGLIRRRRPRDQSPEEFDKACERCLPI